MWSTKSSDKDVIVFAATCSKARVVWQSFHCGRESFLAGMIWLIFGAGKAQKFAGFKHLWDNLMRPGPSWAAAVLGERIVDGRHALAK